MYLSIFLASLGFLVFFVWYLAADNAASRRAAGLGAIIASLLTCGLALYPLNETIHLGLDLRGGTEFLVEVQGNPDKNALDQAASVIRKRLDVTGTREISILPENDNRLRIQIPGLAGAQVAMVQTQISQAAKLELRLVPANQEEILSAAETNGGKLPFQYVQDYEILPEIEKNMQGKDTERQIVVNRQAELSGGHVVSARRSFDPSGQPLVLFQLDSEGTKVMANMCINYPGRQMAIVLDHVVKSAPTLPTDQSHYILNGSGEISGSNMSASECDELASVMENPLENPIKVLSVNSVDASLGADSIRSGLQAGEIALLLVVCFMAIYYRVSGLIAVLALTVNLVLLFGLLAQFHFTLTLPGIAGIVLTIGMAVDANVLIYERIRDELALGKPASHAIDTGFEKAFSAIFDSNVTTLIPAVVLAYLGTGPLRGFAVTLALGIVANLFSSLVVSRNAFDWILSRTQKPNLGMMQFIKSPRIDFLRFRYFGLAFSLVILLIGGLTIGHRGEAVLGVDFKGGDAVTLTYQQEIEIGRLRDALTRAGFKDFVLQPSPLSHALLVQTEQQQGAKAAQTLQQDFPQAGFDAGSVSNIGAQVGGEMKQKAVTALLVGLFGILVYAALRFEWSYAVAAAVGQLHDVLIALSIMAALGSELTLPLVGAFLTIAGYSINDKIVVFDRIREGARLREKGSFYEVINRSLNLTLARTILTGSTCLLATGALIVFGGPVIHDFSLAMFIGIMSGIYSSHFISPGLAWWLGRHGGHGTTPVSPANPPARKAAVGVS
jgi:SecD/SecF fusion protein